MREREGGSSSAALEIFSSSLNLDCEQFFKVRKGAPNVFLYIERTITTI